MRNSLIQVGDKGECHLRVSNTEGGKGKRNYTTVDDTNNNSNNKDENKNTN